MKRRLSVLIATLVLALSTFTASAATWTITDVDLISEGKKRDFYEVTVEGRVQTMAQADEVCVQAGFDDAIGVDRNGGYTDVVCADTK